MNICFAASKTCAMQIRAMRIRASRGMTVVTYIQHVKLISISLFSVTLPITLK